MKDPELEIIINELECQVDLTVADYDGIAHALTFLLPEVAPIGANFNRDISTADGAMLVVDRAYPNWNVNIHGRANDQDGHWRCTLRKNDGRDNDVAIGSGRSPVLAQAILAAVLKLTAILKKL